MMRCNCIAWLGACLLAACSSRLGGGPANDDGEESGDTSTSTSTTGTTSDNTSTTSTSTVSTSDSAETDDDILWDVNAVPDHGALPPGPCPPFALGTDVTGDGPLGAFAGNQAWMGGHENFPRIIIFDYAADTAAEEQYAADNHGELLDGPALIVHANVDTDNLPQTVPVDAEHFVNGESQWFMTELTVDTYTYDDFTLEPIFLEGSLAPWPDQNAQGVEGPIRVEYCGRYNPQAWGE